MGLVNIQMTNFENGLNNRNASSLFGSMAQLDPSRFHTFMEDFDEFVAAQWTLVTTGATAQIAADGGVLQLTTGAVATNEESMIKLPDNFDITQPRPTYFRAKIEVDEATECNINVGLADSAALVPNNCVQFRKDTSDLDLDVLLRSGSADIDVALAVASIANATSFTVEFYWDGQDRIYYGANGTPLGFLDASTLPVGPLAPTLSVFAGASGAVALDLDYLFAATERS
jgi:hypothetical protein